MSGGPRLWTTAEPDDEGPVDDVLDSRYIYYDRVTVGSASMYIVVQVAMFRKAHSNECIYSTKGIVDEDKHADIQACSIEECQ